MELEILKVLLITKQSEWGAALEGQITASAGGEGLSLERVEGIEAGLLKATQQRPDLILLGLSAAEQQSLEALQKLRSQLPQIPIVMLSQHEDVALAVEAIQAGAGDYLLSEKVTGAEIIQSLRHVAERSRIFEDWKVAVNQTFLQATRDPLTSLPNRFLLEDRMSVALAEARRRQEMVGVLFLDLDNFKEVNDLEGHGAGDTLLSSVALRLLQFSRVEDTVARMGGDEFVALVHRVKSAQDIVPIADRFLQAFKRPFDLMGSSVLIHASIGVSLYPFDGEEVGALLKAADIAMFRAKRKGGDCFELFNPSWLSNVPTLPITGEARHNILVVEDDEDVLLLLKKRLMGAGYGCVGCRSVEQALALLQAERPDLVLLDLGFRRSSGICFLQNFSEHVGKNRKVPPVVILSGHTDPEIMEFTKALGARRFIPKPFDLTHVVAVIQELIH